MQTTMRVEPFFLSQLNNSMHLIQSSQFYVENLYLCDYIFIKIGHSKTTYFKCDNLIFFFSFIYVQVRIYSVT